MRVPESRVTLTAPGRLIFGLMIFTVAFSVVGGEIEQANGKKPTLNPLLIIFGGTMATSLLTLISHAGQAGETFATGVALVTFTTASLVYGRPVWDAANKAFGSKPTAPVAAATPTTPTTTPTQTAAALAQVA
jgi:hypothetical protein